MLGWGNPSISHGPRCQSHHPHAHTYYPPFGLPIHLNRCSGVHTTVWPTTHNLNLSMSKADKVNLTCIPCKTSVYSLKYQWLKSPRKAKAQSWDKESRHSPEGDAPWIEFWIPRGKRRKSFYRNTRYRLPTGWCQATSSEFNNYSVVT